MKTRICAGLFILLILVATMLPVRSASAVARSETLIDKIFTNAQLYYDGHLVSKGFGVDMSIYSPLGTGEMSFTKTAFAASLASGWSSGSGRTLTYWTPYVGSMWVKVEGNSFYWPHPNVIVTNRGTGGECTADWTLLLDVLMAVIDILRMVLQSPPETEFQSDGHWVKAIARDAGAFAPGRLATAAANFYSLFDQHGYNTLTVTAGADIWVEWFRPMDPNIGQGQNYVGTYSLSRAMTALVDLPPEVTSTPSGPTSGYRGVSYTYSAGTTDPERDNILYEFDWGDGTTTQTGYLPSGTPGSASHQWASTGAFNVRARAKDPYGLWSDWSVYTQMSVTNRSPGTPSTPSGPTSGHRYSSYSYSTSATDPDGDSVQYEYAWGDGQTTLTPWYASGATISASHSWNSLGTYQVKARAKDTYEYWSGWSSILTLNIVNRPPNIPSTPSGPTSGYVGTSYVYSTSTMDPDGDSILYEFNWGDGSTTTVSWFAPGSTASVSHQWSAAGTYYVTVRSEDSYYAWSGWSSNLQVVINNIPNTPPNVSSTPSGTTSAWVYTTYTYSTSTTDPEGDSVRYEFSWGDGQTTITGWCSSGVAATASHYWTSTGTYYVKARAQDSKGEWGGWSPTLSVIMHSGGGCPIISVYDGSEFILEGLLNIHDPDGVDVTSYHILMTTPQPIRGAYLIELLEHPQTDSRIDNVGLYAILENQEWIKLSLISAWHSEEGNVKSELKFSDDEKTQILGAKWNDGISQSIDMKFAALPSEVQVMGFVFVIEGNNMFYKV